MFYLLTYFHNSAKKERVSDYERKVVQQLCEKQHVAWK